MHDGQLVEQTQFGHLAITVSDLIPIDYGFDLPELEINIPMNKVTKFWGTIRVWSKSSKEVKNHILLIFVPGEGDIKVEKIVVEN